MKPKATDNNSLVLAQFSSHALKRMSQRRITTEAIELTLRYGRKIYGRGVKCYVIGKKELEHYAKKGVELGVAEGIHVLVSSSTNEQIITVYRNRKLSNIRPMIKRRG